MNRIWGLLVVLVFINGCFPDGVQRQTCAHARIFASNMLRDTSVHSRPKVVKIGSLLTFDSIVGRVAKIALETAVEDVNSDPNVLNGTKLELTIHDSNSSGLLSIIETTLQSMESKTVALIGPESSTLTHMISYVVKELQVPLLSFTATDPTLSSPQYPFFIRTTHSDSFQMAAIADIIGYCGWRRVVAIYIDDDHGRNGITSLADQFASKRGKISHKAPINPDATREGIRDVLFQVSLMESKVLVLHTSTKWGLDILDVAHDLGMMESGYVWITTDWLSTIIDISSPLPTKSIAAMQGVITLRSYIKDSELKRKFISKWKSLTTFGVSTYSLYAYDTIWLLARALDDFFDQGGKLSFSKGPEMKDSQGRLLNLDHSLSVFNGGKILLEDILRVKMNGTTGPIEFTSDETLVFPAFEVINVMRTGFRSVGYWSNSSRLSTSPPETHKTNQSSSSQQLDNVIWPGETVNKPRGWILPQNGKLLRVGVPVRVSFQDLVKEVKGTDTYIGYSIDVFVAAVNLLPYAVPYQFYPYGDGHKNPSHTDLVNLVNAGVYDAAVGDIAIITNRTSIVDFTQPYTESGLVVVARVRKLSSGTWAFFKPFTAELWCVMWIFFLAMGAVVWILEHRKNKEFRGTPKQQVVTTLWFIFSTPFYAHRQNTRSTLGRFLVILWLFGMMIISQSYTASLTSILTVQKLSSPVDGINSLISRKERIGYQARSFVRDYLVKEMGISESRLVPLNLPEDYEKALNDGPENGGVIAVVDERPYIELFLSTRCQFSIVGPEFTKNGWGFAFQQDSHLAIDVSNAILKLSETGELQRIHNKWLLQSPCSSQGAELSVDRLELKRFKGLFFVIGLACVLSLFVYLVTTIHRYTKRKPDSSVPSGPRHMQTFISSIDEKEESVVAHSKKRHRGTSSLRSNKDDASVNAYGTSGEESSSNTVN